MAELSKPKLRGSPRTPALGTARRLRYAAETLAKERMPKGTKKTAAKNDTAANLGYEAKLWKADALKRWKSGVPPVGNASFARVQHTR